ncbi:MAG: hypothetical protein ACE5QW_08925 [Thermoplasmata archaeon]
MKAIPFLVAILLSSSALAFLIPSGPYVNEEEQPSPFSSDWRIEPIAYFGGSSEPDIAIDSLNRPHVLYCPPGEVWYGFRANLTWNLELVTETVGGGICGTMALNEEDNPHLNFYIPSKDLPLSYRYAYKKGGSWHFLPVVDDAADMEIDSEGATHAVIGRWDPSGSRRILLSHVTLRDINWTIEDVDTLSPSGNMGSAWASLQLDGNDNPHILYYADTIGEVRYAYRENGTWKIEVVDVIGNIQIVGRQGSLALDSRGRPHASYYVRLGKFDAEIRYATHGDVDWYIESVDRGSFPSIDMNYSGGLTLLYRWGQPINPDNTSFDSDLIYATRNNDSWAKETVFDGHQYIEPRLDIRVTQFPTFERDSCGNPHVVFYLSRWEGMDGSNSGVYYATNGEPCPPEPESEPSVSLDIDPNTLNLKSRGRWITAYLAVENASVEDIDISSILLQDTLVPERYDYQDDVLMLKFDRQELQSVLVIGESVEIKIGGKWKDGTEFEAYDCIRVINPGKG